MLLGLFTSKITHLKKEVLTSYSDADTIAVMDEGTTLAAAQPLIDIKIYAHFWPRCRIKYELETTGR